MKQPKDIDNFEALGITSDAQLREFAMDRGYVINFIGFANEIPIDTVPLGHNIINLGGTETDMQGTHWVYWYNDPKLKFSLYFDSFGVGPEDRIFDISFKPIYINHKQVQREDEEWCGIWCINCATFVERTKDKKRAIKDFVAKYKDVSKVEYNDIHL